MSGGRESRGGVILTTTDHARSRAYRTESINFALRRGQIIIMNLDLHHYSVGLALHPITHVFNLI